MKVLGIDTSTMMGAVGIVEGEDILAELRTNVAVTHSERLMLHIDGLLRSARLTLDDIGGFAVTVGPGSFTGLRIGLAAVKGLAYGTGRPVAGISSLDVLADNLPYSRYQAAPALDARKGMVYAALYRTADGAPVMLMPPSVITPDGLAETITEPTIFVGEGAYVYREYLAARLGDKALFAPRAYGYPSGAAVAFRGLREIMAGRASALSTLAPMYIREPGAREPKQPVMRQE